MELGLLEQSIAVGRTIFEQTLEQPLDAEFTLPDYYPEITRILKCCVRPAVTSKNLSGSVIAIDGTAAITLIYADADGEVFGFHYQLPFNRTVDLGGPASGGSVSITCDAVMEHSGCRAVSSRRISVHSAAALKLKAVLRENVQTLADIDDSTVQTLRETRSAAMPMAVVEKQFTIEEELGLDSGKTSVTVVCVSGDAVCTDCKIMGGKVVIKGRLAVNGLYKSAAGCERLTADLPISQIMDVEGITEGCSCLAAFEVLSLELRPKTAVSGEVGAFVLTARIGVTAEAFCNSEISLIRDAFCTKFESTLEKTDVTLERPLRHVSENLMIKKHLDFSDGAFAQVLDVWCDLGREAVTLEDNTLVIKGDLQACVLGKDASGAAVYFERNTDYEHRVHLEQMPGRMKCATSVHMGGVSFVQQGSGSVELRCEIKVMAVVSELESLSVVCGMNLLEDQPKNRAEDGSLVMYFASTGEKLWDIARCYNTSCEEILRVNELSSDTVLTGTMLLIPCLY